MIKSFESESLRKKDEGAFTAKGTLLSWSSLFSLFQVTFSSVQGDVILESIDLLDPSLWLWPWVEGISGDVGL